VACCRKLRAENVMVKMILLSLFIVDNIVKFCSILFIIRMSTCVEEVILIDIEITLVIHVLHK
jgi:hypothetical protein